MVSSLTGSTSRGTLQQRLLDADGAPAGDAVAVAFPAGTRLDSLWARTHGDRTALMFVREAGVVDVALISPAGAVEVHERFAGTSPRLAAGPDDVLVTYEGPDTSVELWHYVREKAAAFTHRFCPDADTVCRRPSVGLFDGVALVAWEAGHSPGVTIAGARYDTVLHAPLDETPLLFHQTVEATVRAVHEGTGGLILPESVWRGPFDDLFPRVTADLDEEYAVVLGEPTALSDEVATARRRKSRVHLATGAVSRAEDTNLRRYGLTERVEDWVDRGERWVARALRADEYYTLLMTPLDHAESKKRHYWLRYGPTPQRDPTVASNNELSLIAWESGRSVVVTRVRNEDGVVLDPDGLWIHDAESPSIATDGTDFMVAFGRGGIYAPDGVWVQKVMAEGATLYHETYELFGRTTTFDGRLLWASKREGKQIGNTDITFSSDRYLVGHTEPNASDRWASDGWVTELNNTGDALGTRQLDARGRTDAVSVLATDEGWIAAWNVADRSFVTEFPFGNLWEARPASLLFEQARYPSLAADGRGPVLGLAGLDPMTEEIPGGYVTFAGRFAVRPAAPLGDIDIEPVELAGPGDVVGAPWADGVLVAYMHRDEDHRELTVVPASFPLTGIRWGDASVVHRNRYLHTSPDDRGDNYPGPPAHLDLARIDEHRYIVAYEVMEGDRRLVQASILTLTYPIE